MVRHLHLHLHLRPLRSTLAVVAVLSLGGCGLLSGEPEAPTKMTKPTNRSAKKLSSDLHAAALKAKTVQYTGFIAPGAGGKGSPSVRAEGEARVASPTAYDLTITKGSQRIRLLSVKGRLYATSDNISSGQWVQVPPTSTLSPSQVISSLSQMGLGAKKVTFRGVERHNGAVTAHYTLVVDTKKGQLSKLTTAASLPVELWVDDRDLVREIVVGSVSKPLSRETFAKWGAKVSIAPPGADSVIKR